VAAHPPIEGLGLVDPAAPPAPPKMKATDKLPAPARLNLLHADAAGPVPFVPPPANANSSGSWLSVEEFCPPTTSANESLATTVPLVLLMDSDPGQ
jgi:hypothetical protein